MKQIIILKGILLVMLLQCATILHAQVTWLNVDADFAPLPKGMHVFMAKDSVDGKVFKAFYADCDLHSANLEVTSDTSFGRRLTPQAFYNKLGQPVLVINASFFAFETNKNLNLVIKNGKTLAYNINSAKLGGADTLLYDHRFQGAFGISKKHRPDVAWIFSDSTTNLNYAAQNTVPAHYKDADSLLTIAEVRTKYNSGLSKIPFKKWKVQTAVGGGPVLLQNGQVLISNDAEQRFAGKGLLDRHPRTLIGYTAAGHMIIMAVEGRNPGIADGITLPIAAQLMQQVGCVEAINLDGGGSSCMIINGKETIKPSDKTGERPVPAVLVVHQH